MASNVEKLPPVALSLNQPPASSPEVEPKPRVAPQPSADGQADWRLVIEEDPALPGSFIYKTVDWATGKVISQFPREELVKLREDPAYQAGTVVKTTA
jgi:flagellar protein FlaG